MGWRLSGPDKQQEGKKIEKSAKHGRAAGYISHRARVDGMKGKEEGGNKGDGFKAVSSLISIGPPPMQASGKFHDKVYKKGNPKMEKDVNEVIAKDVSFAEVIIEGKGQHQYRPDVIVGNGPEGVRDVLNGLIG
jgi:hypothetical protein